MRIPDRSPNSPRVRLNRTPGDRPTITPSVRFSEPQTGQDILITMDGLSRAAPRSGSPAMYSASCPAGRDTDPGRGRGAERSRQWLITFPTATPSSDWLLGKTQCPLDEG